MLNVSGILVLGVTSIALAAIGSNDPTARALERCLDAAGNASTAGQTDCVAAATSGYDRRMNVADGDLMRRLPTAAADRLRRSQRAWLAFRNAEAAASNGIFATTQGTMFVPMEADAASALVASRAHLLERYVRILNIE